MIPVLMLALALVGQNDDMPAREGVEGLWTNPSGSVQVRTGPCGQKLCGWVVWANEKAKADAARNGGGALIGATLLRNYQPSGRARWTGQLYVPDMKASFGSTITLVDAQTLRVRGCALGGLLCRTQDWRRIGAGGAASAR